jgi:hypothetical protein
MHYHTSGLATALDPLTRFTKEMGARSDPQRNPLHPALRLEEAEPGQLYLDMTRAAPAAASPEPPMTWTARLKKS